MEEAATSRIEERLRSAFPAGAIERVQVLEYSDDPEVEPGQTAIRVFFGWAGRLEGKKADSRIVHAFCTANSAALDKLRGELPHFIKWIEFQPGTPDGTARHDGLAYRIVDRAERAAAPDAAPEELTPVMTRLGPADLATMDTLITAGIANSRAEVVRWALGRIREHPAYAQIQKRVQEINELKAQF